MNYKQKLLTAINFIWLSLISLGCLVEIFAIICIFGLIAIPGMIIGVASALAKKTCLHCRSRIDGKATKCPECGGWQDSKNEKQPEETNP